MPGRISTKGRLCPREACPRRATWSSMASTRRRRGCLTCCTPKSRFPRLCHCACNVPGVTAAVNSLCSHRPQYVCVGGTQLRPTDEAIGYLDEVMIVQGGKKLLKTFIAFKLSNENVCAPVPGLAPRGRRRRQMRSSRRFHTSASFEPRVLACGDVFGPVAIACNVVWRATSYIPPPVGVRRLQCHVRPSVSVPVATGTGSICTHRPRRSKR